VTPFALGHGPKYHALSSANDQWKLGNPTECADRDRGRVHHRKEHKRRSNVPIYQFMSAKKQRAVIVDDHPAEVIMVVKRVGDVSFVKSPAIMLTHIRVENISGGLGG
jgi:hypothetical protein